MTRWNKGWRGKWVGRVGEKKENNTGGGGGGGEQGGDEREPWRREHGEMQPNKDNMEKCNTRRSSGVSSGCVGVGVGVAEAEAEVGAETKVRGDRSAWTEAGHDESLANETITHLPTPTTHTHPLMY